MHPVSHSQRRKRIIIRCGAAAVDVCMRNVGAPNECFVFFVCVCGASHGMCGICVNVGTNTHARIVCDPVKCDLYSPHPRLGSELLHANVDSVYVEL